jgi:Tfp pilus assembly PilM family ATPase
MISRTQRILGLDIGSNIVKGVELAKNGDRYTITGFAQCEIASAGTLKDAILAVIKEGRFKSKQVVSSVSGRSVIVRYVNTPAMKPDELKASMRFEADKYIPFELEEVILDTAGLEENPNENGDMRVVLVAVKKDVVDEHVRLLQEVGLYPYIIDVDCFALGNSFEMAGGAFAAVEPSLAEEPSVEAVDEDEAEQVEESEDAESDEIEEDLGDDSYAETAEDDDSEIEAVDAPISAGAAEANSAFMALDEALAEAEESVDAFGEDIEATGEEEEDPNKVKLASAIPDLDEDGKASESTDEEAEEKTADAPAGGVYALVDIGAQKTNINIVNGGTSCFTREVYVGGEDMTEAVAKHLGVTPVEAEAVKRQGDQEAAVLEAVGQTLDDLANEIFLSFDYFENQFENDIETVYISGGGSRLKGIESVFGETLGRSVRAWNPTAGMEIALPEEQANRLRDNAPQLAVAVGLASRLRRV